MSNFTKNVLGLSISIVAVVLVFGGAIWGVTSYVDSHYGSGTSGLIFMLLGGVGVTIFIYTVSNFQTNRTHQSAGDDITDFAKNMVKAQAAGIAVQREYARMERERASIEGKRNLIDVRSQAKRDDYTWRQQQRRIAMQQQQQEREQQQMADAEWWTVGNDAEFEEEVLR